MFFVVVDLTRLLSPLLWAGMLAFPPIGASRIHTILQPRMGESALSLSLSHWPSLSLSSASSAEKSPDWSDDESGGNPFAANGEGNPFEDETPASPEISVAVRALYDYEGQEQDELSFKAGGHILTIKGIFNSSLRMLNSTVSS